MFINKKTKISIFFAILASLLAFNFVFVNSSVAAPISEEEVEMEAKIKELEDKIAKYREGIINNQNKAKSLQTEISTLDNEANKAELEIKRIDLIIQRLARGIPLVKYPISKLLLYGYWLPRIIWTIATVGFDRQVSPQEAAMLRVASRFWLLSIGEWLFWNIVLTLLVTVIAGAMSIPLWAKFFSYIPFALNSLLSFFSIVPDVGTI